MTEEMQSKRNIAFGKPMIGETEQKAVQDVLNGPTLVHGDRTKAFEDAFASWTGAPVAVSVSSCTAAMHLAYFDLGIAPGDEVIMPAQTHTATAHAVELAGGKPVFVDVERASGNIDAALVEAALTERTRALAVVHFLGEPVDMKSLVDIAGDRGLYLLEDCALAIGTRLDGVHAGLLGDIGCFSFYPVKHMTTAEGGMVITRDLDLAARIARKRAFGVDRTPHERTIPGVYDVTMLGFNYRMNEIEAAIGVEQVARLDDFLQRRRSNFRALSEGLADVEEVTILGGSDGGVRQSSFYCLEAVLAPELEPKRFDVVDALRAAGIGTSIYYPRPVPLMSYYRERYGYVEGDFPVAEWIADCGLALPVGPHLDGDDMTYIATSLKDAIGSVSR